MGSFAHMQNIGIVLIAVILYMIPSPIDPEPYIFTEKPPPLVGPLAINNKLQKLEHLFEGQIIGPESFTADDEGWLYTGSADGRVWKFNSTDAEVLMRTGIDHHDCGTFAMEPVCGRPKGMGIHPDGYLYVLDSYKGIFRVDTKTGEFKQLLTNNIDGKKSEFFNGLTISSNGDIYFTDSSSKWDRRNYRYEVIELNNYGRVLHYRPDTGKVRTLVDKLYLANGIQLSKDESFLLIAQMNIHRLSKYYLSGPKSGQLETFHGNLPGYPDNIKLSSKGTFYVGLGSVRYEGSSPIGSFLDIIAPYPALKRFIVKVLPLAAYSMFLPKHAMLLEFDDAGHVLNSFHDPEGAVVATGLGEAFEYRGAIYTGYFNQQFVGYITVNDLYGKDP